METIIAGAFCLLIGIVGLWTGFRQLKNLETLNRWKTTKGRVIERSTYQPGIATLSNSAFRHAPLVRYVYQVDAQEFVNDCIHPKRIQLPQHNTQRWAQKRAESFADEVMVHYNPEDPNESILVQTPKRMLYIVIGVSCLVILFGTIFLLTKWVN
ncbi:MAG: DUF3592 domain-containing protein [Pyrinomonadaceae bacterium]